MSANRAIRTPIKSTTPFINYMQMQNSTEGSITDNLKQKAMRNNSKNESVIKDYVPTK